MTVQMTWKERKLLGGLVELVEEMEEAHDLADHAEMEIVSHFGEGNNSDFVHGCKLVTRLWAEKLADVLVDSSGAESLEEISQLLGTSDDEEPEKEGDPKAPKNPA